MTDRELTHVQTLEPRCMLTVAFESSWATLPALQQGLQGVSALVADMNGDGRADVVMAWDSPTRVLAAHLSNGDGTFTTVGAVFGTAPGHVRALGDFDGDGDTDAIVDSSYFFNNGAGVLIERPADPLLTSTSTLASIDVDGDGQIELAIKDGGELKLARLVGTVFVQISSLAVDETFSLEGDVSIVDISGDGRADLALFRSNPTPQTQLVFNDAGVLRLGPVLEGEATLADGTIDGIADRFTVSTDEDSSLQVFRALGQGDGTFGAPVLLDTLRTGWVSPSLSKLARDVNGDGRPDLLVTQTLALVYSSTEVIVSNSAGHYVSGSASSGMGLSSSDAGSVVQGAADFDNDGRLDLWGPSFSFGIDQNVRISRQITGATITGISASATSLRPLEVLTLTATVDRGQLRQGTVPFVEFYFDNDRDGTLSLGDTLITSVSTPDTDGAYRYDYVHADTDPVGLTTILAVARYGAISSAMTTDVTLWGRIFYPEGFRNDASINEYLSIVNPLSRAVQYQVIARYETGERDQVIATGQIEATSRGGVTIVERGRPENNLTREGVGYTLELQADGALGATFAHYDTFATETTEQSGGGEGEALSSVTSTDWSFADVSTATFDFLLFFNPSAADTVVQVRFFDGDQAVIQKDVSVASLRRGGLSLRDIAELAPGQQYAVTISSATPIATVHSRYRQDGAAWGASGVSRADVQVMPGIEIRPSAISTVSLYNTHTESITVTLDTSFDVGATATTSIIVGARQRISFDPLASAPTGATVASLRFSGLLPEGSETGEVLITAATDDAARGDIISGGASAAASTIWAFGDAFLAQATAGIFEFETLVVYNPTDSDQDVTVRYFFTNGTSAERVLSVPARRPAALKLETETAIVDHAQLNYFGITVTGADDIVASLTHWDLSQRGGWLTLGTPLNFVPLPGIGT